MPRFDPAAYGPVVAALLAEERLNVLGPGAPNEKVRAALATVTIESVFGDRPLRDRDLAAGCCAGLWLYHDYFDESHRICQEIPTAEGSYWHGILHRREPDFSNSKYWFRRVGAHPIFQQLCKDAAETARSASPGAPADYLISQGAWDPMAFIDLCQACFKGQSSAEMLCREIQRREWQLLFDYCFHHASRH